MYAFHSVRSLVLIAPFGVVYFFAPFVLLYCIALSLGYLQPVTGLVLKTTPNLNGTFEDEETLKDLEKRSTRLRARTFVFCSLFLTRLQADYQVRPEF